MKKRAKKKGLLAEKVLISLLKVGVLINGGFDFNSSGSIAVNRLEKYHALLSNKRLSSGNSSEPLEQVFKK